MMTNKSLVHKDWFNKLNVILPEAAYIACEQFFNFIINENPKKIKFLKEQADKKINDIICLAKKALTELEPLLDEVKKTLEKSIREPQYYLLDGYRTAVYSNINNIAELQWINETYYNWRRDSDTIRVGMYEFLPHTLFVKIDEIIYGHREDANFDKFRKLLSSRADDGHIDYDKFGQAYSNYIKFDKLVISFNTQHRVEAWGAYDYLQWQIPFYKDVAPLSTRGVHLESNYYDYNAIKNGIVDNFNRLILYIEASDKREISKKNYNTTFDADKSILNVGNKSIKIRPSSVQFSLLSLLFKNKKNLSEEQYFAEIEGRDDITHSTNNKKYYNAMYQINKKIKKTGIEDFISKMTSHTFQINPKYL